MMELPYKSVAAALMFCIFFGPLGLLYATWWGGMAMMIVALLLLVTKQFFSFFFCWFITCIWSVAAVEIYNKKLLLGKVVK